MPKANVLGLTIFNNLLWNDHVTETIKKANKRLYSLVLLKRAGAPLMDTKNFYCATIRPVLEYCSPVFHRALPQCLSAEIGRVQKRTLSIMNPNHTYEANLAQFGLATLHKRRQDLCDNQFERISTNSHELSYLLPPTIVPTAIFVSVMNMIFHKSIHTDLNTPLSLRCVQGSSYKFNIL